MKCPQFLTLEPNFACYRPISEVTLSVGVEMIDAAIRFCRDNSICGLLIDINGLTGFEPPSTTERFVLMTRWVDASNGRVILSMIAPAAMMDPQKFGVTVGRNRGLSSEIFLSESEARSWLIEQLARTIEE